MQLAGFPCARWSFGAAVSRQSIFYVLVTFCFVVESDKKQRKLSDEIVIR